MKRQAWILCVLCALAYFSIGQAWAAGQNEAESAPGTAGPTELSLWIGINNKLQGKILTYDDVPFWQELQKRTKVDLKFIHPAAGQQKEQFNLMIASGEYPDMMSFQWSTYPGGPAKAIADKVVEPLNSLIESNGPNIRKLLQDFPVARKYIQTSDGNIYTLATVYTHPMQLATQGLIVRSDWLKDLGLKDPVTLDDWYAMLKQFKEKKGAKSPLAMRLQEFKDTSAFASAFGVGVGYYQDNGKVKYGPAEPEFKAFLTYMNKLYSEGLLDPDFASLDRKTIDAKMISGQAGAAYGPTKGGVVAWNNALRAKLPSATVLGAGFPVRQAGQRVGLGKYNDEVNTLAGAAISTKSKNKAKAMEFIDYAYTDEGTLLFNFGILGTSYTMVDGKPKYTDMIMKSVNPAPIDVLAMYAPAADGGIWQKYDYGFNAQMDDVPEIHVTRKNWTDSSTYKNVLPAAVVPLPADSSRYSALVNEIATYVDEMVLKFIMGQESLDRFDVFQTNLKNKNVSEATSILQKSYDLFYK